MLVVCYTAAINFSNWGDELRVLKRKRSRIYGWGCFTLVPVKKRQRIGTYEGELVRGRREIERRIRAQERDGVIKVIQMSNSLAIDGAVGGNETAHINHSCEPNTFMQEVPGNRVMFFALRDIAAGEEITIDYRAPNHPEAHLCRCGSSRCRSSARKTGSK